MRVDDVDLATAGVYYQNLLVWNDKLRTLAGVRTDFYKVLSAMRRYCGKRRASPGARVATKRLPAPATNKEE